MIQSKRVDFNKMPLIEKIEHDDGSVVDNEDDILFLLFLLRQQE